MERCIKKLSTNLKFVLYLGLLPVDLIQLALDQGVVVRGVEAGEVVVVEPTGQRLGVRHVGSF